MRIDILGVGFDNLTMTEAVARGCELLAGEGAHYVVTPNPEIVETCRADAEAMAAVNGADLVLPDGIGVIYGAKLLGTPLKSRVPGIEFGTAMLAHCAETGKKVFLFGAKPGVAEQAAKNLCEKLPGLQIAGTHDGYFTDAESDAIAAEIRTSGADMALVCLGAPKQEKWMAQYGAATMRLHIMFIGDFEKAVTWSNEAVKGSKRFLDRCFNLQDIATAEETISAKNESIVHKTIKKVTQDIDELKMNTAIAAMMTMVNELYANGCSKGDVEMLCLLLSPFAPHMVEEMWENMGFAAKYGKMAMQMPWPTHDEAKTVDSHVEMAVQVNGKLKGTVTVPMDSDEAAVVAAAMDTDKVKKAVEGMSVVKTIHVKNKLVNLIVKPAR